MVADEKGSSAAKGESFADMARVVAGYVVCIVIRQPEAGGARRVADALISR